MLAFNQLFIVAPEHKPAIDAMFALWFMRTHFRGLVAQELQWFGVAGYNITKAHEEQTARSMQVAINIASHAICRNARFEACGRDSQKIRHDFA